MATTTRQATIPITEIEHAAFCKPEDELPAKSLAEEFTVNIRWQKIPDEYLHYSAPELDQRINLARQKLGSTVTILGHHYQREEIIKYADFQGDSFLLSKQAAEKPEADFIVFCGVHFMAETAGILCAPHQKVILPNITAGCSMADMAPMDDVEDGWEDLQEVLGDHGGILPVTYMNSIAGIKALCGRTGGAVCTSSNAAAVLEWAFQSAERVLFLPDQHLGRNTGIKLGIDGCSMADMAPMDDVEDGWEDLQEVLGDHGGILPVTYMNSIAGIKALCGRTGGAVCTSSNAAAVLEWAFQSAERVLFLPDQHLGRNTGIKLGIDPEQMVVWNPFKRLGGNTVEQLRNSKMVLWQGHCAVHTRFTVKQIQAARERFPEVTVLVHPECTRETVDAANMNGSTELIRKTINEAPAGSQWAVGTEISLVNRLALNNPDKTVFCLDPVSCPCSTMYRIHPAYLLWVLDGLLQGEVINQITVPEDIRRDSLVALERMLSLP